MSLKEELITYARSVFTEQTWSERTGQKVPDTDDLSLKNEAVSLDATILYADLADSTELVQRKRPLFAAEIYKTYLYSAAKVIRANGGTITAFDGDRVMAVFIGDAKNSSAARAGLQINWARAQIIQPALDAQYPQAYVVRQKVGIDSSVVKVARTGIRGSNDLVWVGPAANNAAKMAALDLGYATYISADTYGLLNAKSKYSDGTDMWVDLGTSHLGYRIYGSSYSWAIS